MPETPEAFWERAHGALSTPPVEEWDTWPFAGPGVPRALEPPAAVEPARQGEGGEGCAACERGIRDAIWYDDNWLVRPYSEPTGLPFVALLHTRRHVDFPDLDDELAAELGPLLVTVQRAVFAIGEISNVHVCRWGDGSEHCHIWFMAKPARVTQLKSSFAAIWDDVLPPTPEAIWRENIEIVRRALVGSADGNSDR